MKAKQQIRELIFDAAEGNEREMLKFLAEIVEQVCLNLQDETELMTVEDDFWRASSNVAGFI